MLLGHTALTSEQAMELLSGVPLEQIAAELDEENDVPLVLPRGFHRHFIRSDQQEIEAENFGTYIQSQIIQANRLKYLIAASSSIENLRSFTDGLGFQE